MAKCEYCGENAGFLKTKHKECEEKYLNGKEQLLQIAKTLVFGTTDDYIGIDTKITKIVEESYVKTDEFKPILANAFDFAIIEKLEQSEKPLTREEEEQIKHYINVFDFRGEELNKSGNYSRVVKSRAIADLVEGKLTTRESTTKEELPILFKENEKLIWVFPTNTEYHKLQTKSQSAGGYAGTSLRVAKGLYVRLGNYKGESVKSLETVHLDTGHLAFTDKQIYFYGSNKAFKLPYNRILAVEPLKEGVKIQKTHANAFPITLITGDGWFTYNLIINLHKLATEN
jgi:hypothetical protein